VVRATGVFGGPKIVSTARHFQGAWLTGIFGGVTLDLRDAHPAPEGATVNATVVFGGVQVIVPRGWRISLRSTPILGGVEDKTDHSQPPAADAPTLHVDAVTVFGGVEIKNAR
jgi:predicted membrane protein